MIFKYLWERHLFSQLVKLFVFAITSFYLLYIVIDYSIHSHHFSHSSQLAWIDVSTYYFYLLMKRADLILPLAFIIATNRVLLGLNQSHALIALLAGGLHPLRLLTPFFTLALTLAGLLLLNFEYVTPNALLYLESFEHQNFRKPIQIDYSIPSAYSLPVEEGGQILFSKYNTQQRCFEDVYYIAAPDDIWKMKALQLTDSGNEGLYVEHIIRDADHLLIKEASYEELSFPHIHVDLSGTKKFTLPYEQKSLSSLYTIVSNQSFFSKISYVKALTQLNFKLSMPFVSLLLVVGCTPFCVAFSRKLPIFLIYAMSIFGVIAFFVVMDAAVILGEHQILPPGIAILLPYVLCLAGFGKKFIKAYLR